MTRDYRNLEVWNESVELVVHVYAASQNFPQHELNGLTGQLRRAVLAISGNVAQGRSRSVGGEFSQYLRVVRGLLAEVETYLHIAARLGYLTRQREADLKARLETIAGLLVRLRSSLRKESLLQPVH